MNAAAGAAWRAGAAPAGGGRGATTCVADGVFPQAAIEYLNRFAATNEQAARSGSVARADMSHHVARHVRRSDIVWLGETPESRPIYELIVNLVARANAQAFGFDLSGLDEPLQLATYRADDNGFYGWHVDTGAGRLANRKISVVVPLTDPAAYEGGEFEAFFDNEPALVPMPLGRVVMFPSYLLHRVKPVTRGVRRSLAIWISGPPFR